MVQAFEKTKGQADLSLTKQKSNTLLAEARIKSKNHMDILKGSFPGLWKLNVYFKKGKQEGYDIVQLVPARMIVPTGLMVNYKKEMTITTQ